MLITEHINSQANNKELILGQAGILFVWRQVLWVKVLLTSTCRTIFHFPVLTKQLTGRALLQANLFLTIRLCIVYSNAFLTTQRCFNVWTPVRENTCHARRKVCGATEHAHRHQGTSQQALANFCFLKSPTEKVSSIGSPLFSQETGVVMPCATVNRVRPLGFILLLSQLWSIQVISEKSEKGSMETTFNCLQET